MCNLCEVIRGSSLRRNAKASPPRSMHSRYRCLLVLFEYVTVATDNSSEKVGSDLRDGHEPAGSKDHPHLMIRPWQTKWSDRTTLGHPLSGITVVCGVTRLRHFLPPQFRNSASVLPHIRPIRRLDAILARLQWRCRRRPRRKTGPVP